MSLLIVSGGCIQPIVVIVGGGLSAETQNIKQNNVENILLSKHVHHCLATMLAKLCLGSSQWQMNGQQLYHYPFSQP